MRHKVVKCARKTAASILFMLPFFMVNNLQQLVLEGAGYSTSLQAEKFNDSYDNDINNYMDPITCLNGVVIVSSGPTDNPMQEDFFAIITLF